MHRRDVNAALRVITGRAVTLKDFRTMSASARALEELAALEPKQSERGRRRQVLATMRSVAGDLANTPAVTRRSYVHDAVVAAFETGALRRMSRRSTSRSTSECERMLAKVLSQVN